MPLDKTEAMKLVKRRHPVWTEFQPFWRWLEDSLEGGRRYRCADYSIDPTSVGFKYQAVPAGPTSYSSPNNQEYSFDYGFYTRAIANRNLSPHRREVEMGGWALYLARLFSTPVPRFVARAVEGHAGEVYSQEIRRTVPPPIEEWYENVDGKSTDINRWMQETFAPLFLTLGFLDLQFDFPENEDGLEVRSAADELRAGGRRCVVSIVAPEHVVWWKLRPNGEYRECLIFVRGEDESVEYHHWTETTIDVYTDKGDWVADKSRDHGFGRVPVVRVFDRRLPRECHVGMSRYDAIAEKQRTIFNLEADRLESDVMQMSATLSGPIEGFGADSTVKAGPHGVLPKVAVKGPTGQPSGAVGWEYVEPPRGAVQVAAEHINELKDDIDRDAQSAKPAGTTTKATVSISGISKAFDQRMETRLLAQVASSLRAAEKKIAEYAGTVLGVDAEDVEIVYPTKFDMFTSDDLILIIEGVQRVTQQSGALPITERELIKRLAALGLSGSSRELIDESMREIDAFMGRISSIGEANERPVGPIRAVDVVDAFDRIAAGGQTADRFPVA